MQRAVAAAWIFAGAVAMSACAQPTARPADTTPRPAPAAAPTTDASTSRDPDAGAGQAYTNDVWVVMTAPSPVFLLAKFDEAAGEGCEARLLGHARTLGANRLYIDRGVACSGSAYFVRPDAKPGDASVTLRRDVRPADDALVDWLRARWRRPASLSALASQKLCVVVQFTVSPMRRVLDVRGQPIRASGNVEFDESVRTALDSAIAEHANVPLPPRDLLGEVVTYRVEFSPGDPRTCRQPVR